MDIQHKFQIAISNFGLSKGSKVLVAVSGGVDSIVLLHMMHQSNINLIVAHCDFMLRGKESDLDAAFVRQSASTMGITYYEKSFHTAEFASDNGISIQMAARKLRYEWFEELAEQENCTFIAVAHHADDSVETVLLNLVKGTGIAGMHGIKHKHGKIIRPLLNMSRDEIVSYAQQHNLAWRDDSSNAETHYERNYIRHEVLPMLRSLNPKAGEAIANHAIYMQRYEHILDWMTQAVETRISRNYYQGRFTAFDLDLLSEYPEPATLLFHILRKYGFKYDTCEQAIREETESGAQFISGRMILIKDRTTLVLSQAEMFNSTELWQIQESDSVVDLEFGCLQVSYQNAQDEADFGNRHVAYLDAVNLSFPLIIRRVQHGDRFYPLGMQNSKLVSDFFTDSKINLINRTTTYVMSCEEKIIWLLPHRIDERFKLVSSSRKVIRLEWQPVA